MKVFVSVFLISTVVILGYISIPSKKVDNVKASVPVEVIKPVKEVEMEKETVEDKTSKQKDTQQAPNPVKDKIKELPKEVKPFQRPPKKDFRDI